MTGVLQLDWCVVDALAQSHMLTPMSSLLRLCPVFAVLVANVSPRIPLVLHEALVQLKIAFSTDSEPPGAYAWALRRASVAVDVCSLVEVRLR